jgi:hypothetical protein
MGGEEHYHDQTGIRDSAKQASLEVIYGGLNDLLTTDSEEPTIADLTDITLEDIDLYLHKIVQDQDIDAELLRLTEVPIDEKLFRDLCDYLEVSGEPYTGREQVYFMESDMDIVVIIPIDTTQGTTKVRIELWQYSRDFIKELSSYKKPNKSLGTIPFVKL